MLEAVARVKLETKSLIEDVSTKNDDIKYELCSSMKNSKHAITVLTTARKHLFGIDDDDKNYLSIRTIQDLQVLLEILYIKAKALFISGENDNCLRILDNILQLYNCMEDKVTHSMDQMRSDLNFILKKHFDSLHESHGTNLQWYNRYHHVTELINKTLCLYVEIRLREGELMSASDMLKKIIAIEECSPSIRCWYLYIEALVKFNISISGSSNNLPRILNDTWNLHRRVLTRNDIGINVY